MMSQLDFKQPFDAQRGIRGLTEIFLGLILKVVVAGYLAGPFS